MLKDPLSTKPTHTQTYQSRQSPFSNIEWLKLQLLFHEYHLPLYKQLLALSNYWQYHTWKSFVKIEPVLTEVHKSVWYDKEMFIFVCLYGTFPEKNEGCVCVTNVWWKGKLFPLNVAFADDMTTITIIMIGKHGTRQVQRKILLSYIPI